MTQHAIYDADFYAWTQEQAALVRAGKWNEIDLTHVAEELESMGRSEKRELESRLAVLILHLLKWQFQPKRISHSWRLTIKEQRLSLEEHLEDNPSLKSHLPQAVIKAYRHAALLAEKETGLDCFPATCPYSLEQILDEDYFPK